MDADGLTDVDRVPHGGTSDVALDFSANTNTRTPDGAREAYRDAWETASRYPDDDYPSFRRAAAAVVDCDPGDVTPTAGGMRAIRLAVAATVGPDDTALVPKPSFGEYAREIRLQGAEPRFAPAERILDADPGEHALAVVCNPNNPTGRLYDRGRLDAFVERARRADTPVLVDEAFLGFTEQPSLAGTPGALVARSLTKLYGLPGIRAGYLVAPPGSDVAAGRPPWALSAPGAGVGTHCLRDEGFVERTRERIAEERRWLADRLGERFDVRPSDAPFLLLDCGDAAVADVVARANAAGIAVRDARSFRGLDSHVRVAVREREDDRRLVAALTGGNV